MKSTPEILADREPMETLKEMIKEISSWGREVDLKRSFDPLLKMMACRGPFKPTGLDGKSPGSSGRPKELHVSLPLPSRKTHLDQNHPCRIRENVRKKIKHFSPQRTPRSRREKKNYNQKKKWRKSSKNLSLISFSATSGISAVNPLFMEKPKLVVILGPTASGKSSLVVDLALKLRGEIISADSVQVYRDLDVGTAKPSAEQRRLVPHHLIDVLDPDQEYSAALFRRHADEIIHRLHLQKTPIFVAGGTGLYLKVLNRGLFRGPAGDPQLRASLYQKRAIRRRRGSLPGAATPGPGSRLPDPILMTSSPGSSGPWKCVPWPEGPSLIFMESTDFEKALTKYSKIGLHCEKEELYRRIESRVEKMLEMGWVGEVQSLLDRGYSPRVEVHAVSWVQAHCLLFIGRDSLAPGLLDLIKRDTRRYAKRQITWFKSDPEIHWFPSDQNHGSEIQAMVREFFNHCLKNAILRRGGRSGAVNLTYYYR